MPTWHSIDGDFTAVGGEVISNIEVTGAGQDGQPPYIGTTGAGGASVSGDGIHGKGADPSGSPNGGYAYIGNGSGNDEYGPGSYDLGTEAFDRDFELDGGGGASSSTAGGGSGRMFAGVIPAGSAVNLIVGAAGADTTIEDQANTGTFITAGHGGDASGDTPGDGGLGTDDIGWATVELSGNPGTLTTATTGGNGGNGGAWARVTPASLTLTAGDVIRATSGSFGDGFQLDLNPDTSPVALLHVSANAGGDSFTALPDGIASANDGGSGGTVDSPEGAGGGKGATSSGPGADGDPSVTTTGDGAAGVNPGDGGDGAAGDGTNGGAGALGSALFDYTSGGPAFKVWYIQGQIQVSESPFA